MLSACNQQANNAGKRLALTREPLEQYLCGDWQICQENGITYNICRSVSFYINRKGVSDKCLLTECSFIWSLKGSNLSIFYPKSATRKMFPDTNYAMIIDTVKQKNQIIIQSVKNNSEIYLGR